MELNPAFKIVVFCVALLAFTLNSLVIWITVTRDKRKRAIDSQLIGLIAFFDAFVSAFTIISQLIEWISTTPLTFVYGDWCLISSMLFDSSVIVALGLASQLSIVRYLTIVKMRAVKNSTSTVASIIIIAFILAIFITASLKGNTRLMASGMYCIPIHKLQGSIGDTIYSIIMLLMILPNIIIIPTCYCLISRHYQKVTLRLQSDLFKVNKKSFCQQYHPILGLLLISIAYIFSLLLGSENVKFNNERVMGSFLVIFFFLVTIINPLFIPTLHLESSDEFIPLFINGSHPNNLSISA